MSSGNIELQSISLFLDEPVLLKGPSVASLLPLAPLPHKLQNLPKNQEVLSPHITFMPEVFHRRLTGYSKFEFLIINQIYRLIETVRYNFNNGMQITAKEILRHPLHRFVPEELLPLIKSSSLIYGPAPLKPWPLIQNDTGPDIQPVQEIMQSLLDRISMAHRQKKIELYLQTHSQQTKSLKIRALEFSSSEELDWRIDFKERKNLISEFKLVSHRNQRFYFFDSFSLEPVNGIIVVHPWLTEFSLLQERLLTISEALSIQMSSGMPTFEFDNEVHAKKILKYLRTRSLPVSIEGGSVSLTPGQSQTEIHFSDSGHFYLQHEGRVPSQKNITRRGWSERSVFYFLTLSQGLPFAMNSNARDMASNDEFKREWDMGLLKHLGILQFIFHEALCVHFHGSLSDGTPVSKDAILTALDEKIKLLLASNQGFEVTEFTRLEDLCSKSVLSCFEKFIETIYADLKESESFYSESGEVTMGGVLERELRLIYELLSRLAIITSGAAFKKVRSPLLGRISMAPLSSESAIAKADYFFPECSLSSALEIVQSLVPFGFKIFLQERPIQELGEADLKMDFILNNKMDQTQINWFELSPKFFLMGQEVDADRFLGIGGGGIIEYENKLYMVHKSQIPSLRLLEDFWTKLQKGKVESARKKKEQSVFQLPRSQTLFLLALRAAGIPFHGDQAWNQLCEFYDQLGTSLPSFNVPETINAELKNYQRQGVQWLQDLYRLRLGALLADDMGLGKTLQALTFIEDLRIKKDMGPVLVVVPSSLVYNWCNEIEKFAPQIPVTIFSGENKEIIAQGVHIKTDRLIIITYGLLLEHTEVLTRDPWNVIIFDEAQNIKNISAKRTTAARALKSRFKIALSGTPMENHFGEFYSIMDTLVPGCLGPIEDFRRQYVNSPVVDYEIIKDLKLKMKPLVLRRAKKEILDQLPEKQETTTRITFEDQQKEIYRNIALSYNQRIHEAMSSQGTALVQLEMFTALLRLRQVCSDPTGLPEVVYKKTPPKLETLVESAKEVIANGESALIFTQFIQTLEHTEKLLKACDLPVFVLHGGISISKRQKILSEFNSLSGGAILLMTLKTGGVGLNLTKASYVFHIEPWWNPSVENQATDRAHRMGQTKSVQVFKYIMHESLEEKIELLKERKEKKFQSLFSETESVTQAKSTGSISKEDFDLLIQI